jgi:hypothetical protein
MNNGIASKTNEESPSVNIRGITVKGIPTFIKAMIVTIAMANAIGMSNIINKIIIGKTNHTNIHYLLLVLAWSLIALRIAPTIIAKHPTGMILTTNPFDTGKVRVEEPLTV